MTAFLLPLLCAALLVALGTAPLVRRDRRRSRASVPPGGPDAGAPG